MDLDTFEKLALSRRAVRHFKPDPLPEGLLERLLTIAHWAPSGYNLQPTHYVVVTDPEVKKRLRIACFWQVQVEEAPATVVFCGDRDVVRNNFEKMIAAEREAGAMTEKYEKSLRKFVPLAFETGPAGIAWCWKCAAPLAANFKPVPSIPAVHRRFWLSKQVSLCAMNFMLAARAAGLGTVPMEGFDERRVRQVLGIPRSQIPMLVVPVGHPSEQDYKRSRLPVDQFIHRNGW